jgi:hypothetical protein
MTLKLIFAAKILTVSTLLTTATPVWAATPPINTGLDIKEAQQLEVNGVKVENFAGQVIVKSAGAGKTVRVSLKGADDLLRQVAVSDDHETNKGNLYIAFEKEAPVLKDVSTLTLTLEMPSTMPLDLSIVGGKAEIGKRDSNETKVHLNGFGDVKMMSVKDLESKIDGSGEITVMEGHGNMVISIRGDGKYDIQKGSIPNLKASIQGTGEINVTADVGNAELTSQGAGIMNLRTASGKVSQSISGAGTINITKVQGSLKNKVSGSGQFDMECSTASKK